MRSGQDDEVVPEMFPEADFSFTCLTAKPLDAFRMEWLHNRLRWMATLSYYEVWFKALNFFRQMLAALTDHHCGGRGLLTACGFYALDSISKRKLASVELGLLVVDLVNQEFHYLSGAAHVWVL